LRIRPRHAVDYAEHGDSVIYLHSRTTSGGGMALSQRLYKLQGLTVCGDGEAASIVVDAAS
jgi:hypothetical protein